MECFDCYFHIPLPIVTKHKLGLPFPPRNHRIKFGTNPSTIFLVIMVTDRHTQIHKPTPVKTYSLAFAGRITTQNYTVHYNNKYQCPNLTQKQMYKNYKNINITLTWFFICQHFDPGVYRATAIFCTSKPVMLTYDLSCTKTTGSKVLSRTVAVVHQPIALRCCWSQCDQRTVLNHASRQIPVIPWTLLYTCWYQLPPADITVHPPTLCDQHQ